MEEAKTCQNYPKLIKFVSAKNPRTYLRYTLQWRCNIRYSSGYSVLTNSFSSMLPPESCEEWKQLVEMA